MKFPENFYKCIYYKNLNFKVVTQTKSNFLECESGMNM